LFKNNFLTRKKLNYFLESKFKFVIQHGGHLLVVIFLRKKFTFIKCLVFDIYKLLCFFVCFAFGSRVYKVAFTMYLVSVFDRVRFGLSFPYYLFFQKTMEKLWNVLDYMCYSICQWIACLPGFQKSKFIRKRKSYLIVILILDVTFIVQSRMFYCLH